MGTGSGKRQGGGIKKGSLEEGSVWLDVHVFTEWKEPSRGSFLEGTLRTKAGERGCNVLLGGLERTLI